MAGPLSTKVPQRESTGILKDGTSEDEGEAADVEALQRCCEGDGRSRKGLNRESHCRKAKT